MVTKTSSGKRWMEKMSRRKDGVVKGFRITDAEVHLVGYCPECQRRLLDNADDGAERR
jgi:hypothetical protein